MTRELAPYLAEADADLGPAMRELNPLMRGFVHALVQTGCTNTQAARLAGYTGNAATLKATGYRLAHDPRVQAAMHEEAQKLVRSHGLMALHVVADIARNTKAEAKDRLRAAGMILDRAGLSAVTEHKVTVERKPDTQEMLRRVRDMALRLNLDPVQLLGSYGYVVDAEFTTIEPADEWTIVPSEVGRG